MSSWNFPWEMLRPMTHDNRFLTPLSKNSLLQRDAQMYDKRMAMPMYHDVFVTHASTESRIR